MKKEDMELICPKCGVGCADGFIAIDTWRIEWGETYFSPEDGEWCDDKMYDSEAGIGLNPEVRCTSCGHKERMKDGKWNKAWGNESLWPMERTPMHINEFKLNVIIKELFRRTKHFFWWYGYVKPKVILRDLFNITHVQGVKNV